MTTEPDHSQAAGRGAVPQDTFAHRLMLARAHAGHLSIREAADLCGLGRGAWTNWEKGGGSNTRIDDATAIAKGLGVDREWLLFGGALAEAAPTRRTVRRRGREESPVSDRKRDRAGWGLTTLVRPPDTRPAGHPVASGVRRSVRLPRHRGPHA